jgi:hypothetical protein
MLVEHRKWRREARLTYLREERERWTDFYANLLQRMQDFAYGDTTIAALADMEVKASPEVRKRFYEFVDNYEAHARKSEEERDTECREFTMDIAVLMREHVKRLEDDLAAHIEGPKRKTDD